MATKKHREKQIEARLTKRVKEHGGVAAKFTSPGRRSVPDRVVTMPCAEPPTFFVEAKAPGQTPTDAQDREHTRIRDLRDRLEAGLQQRISHLQINGKAAPRLPNTSNVSCHYVEGEAMLCQLSDRGICASR